jgi:uncharacterized protein (TIGR02996 family)
MSDRDALLAAVFDHPADDAPRLVYADWLDEHGEPAQAAFVRAQVELARSDPNADEHDGIAARVDALWDPFVAELGPAAGGAGLLPGDFRRGFPAAAINVLVSAFRDYSPRWWPWLPIRAVTIDLTSSNVGELVRIPYLTRLRELVLYGDDPHGRVIPRLAKCRYFHELRVLDLNQFGLGVEAADALATSDAFPRLEELRLPYAIRPTRGIGRMLRQKFGDVCRF